MTNTIRAFLVLFFFGLLTACGGGGGNNTAGTNPIMTTPDPMTMTVTMPDNPAPTAPVTLAFDAPELGGFRYNAASGAYWLVILSVAEGGEDVNLFGLDFNLQRQIISVVVGDVNTTLSELNRASLHAHGDIVPLANTTISGFTAIIAFQNRPTITAITQLCPISWFVDYIPGRHAPNTCSQMSQLSYTPNMPNVLHAAMADTFHRGIGIGESRFAFSGRHNGNDRAAGFTYDMGGYALRTDYVHLPSKQDSGVFLDTYRFGIVRPINDETRFFAGVDSYRNAIFAIDTNGKNLHRFGIAAGDGYAVRYEYRIRL